MIRSIDHLVLTIGDLEATVGFYRDGLGMRLAEFGGGRLALHFGEQKLNLHLTDTAAEPRAARPTPGSADLCLLTDHSLEEVSARMASVGHPVVLGPVDRTGATGPIQSVYFRDPDGNLVEVSRRV